MKKVLISISLLLAALLLVACGGSGTSSPASSSQQNSASASESQPQEDENTMDNMVYRGKVTEVNGTQVTVEQVLPGYNYGQQQIVFNVSEETNLSLFTPADSSQPETSLFGWTLPQDAFVEVSYSGVLSRSMPPQAPALELVQLSNTSDNIIVNGTIITSETTSDGYRLHIEPIEENVIAEQSEDVPMENQIILVVPENALEQLSVSDLTEGKQISAVTQGVAALSLPPQMPVHALLPYSG